MTATMPYIRGTNELSHVHYNFIIHIVHKLITLQPTWYEVTPGLKPFTRMLKFVNWEFISQWQNFALFKSQSEFLLP